MLETEAIESRSRRNPAHVLKCGSGFSQYTWAVLAYNVGVVLWGAFVRATGSGAGCGNHWPLCNGEVTPRSPTTETLIEFTHRVTTGLDLLLVAVMVFWAFRAFPRRHPVRRSATLSGVFLVSEALIGACLVLLEHVAANPSPARGYSLSLHLVNTLSLLASLTLTAWWAMGRPPVRLEGRPTRRAGASLAGVAVLCITGTIAALGDTLFPAASIAAGIGQEFDPAANMFVRLRVLHPLAAAATTAWLLYYAWSIAAGKPESKRLSGVVAALARVQVLAGIVNWLLLAPVWMQIVHLLLADLLWISLVLLCASNLSMKEPR